MTNHVPVLLNETIAGLDPQDGDILLDGTLGGGGHSLAFCKQLSGHSTIVGLDADAEALKRAENNLSKAKCELHLECDNFRNLKKVLEKLNLSKVDKILLDLGMGSHTFESGRGFSFQKDEPLLMTFKHEPGQSDVTAYDVVNIWSEESLREIFYGFGEEKYGRVIAHAIVVARERKRIETTKELVDLIREAVPHHYRIGRIHPATRTFQAIRMAVNDELNSLTAGLEDGWQCLKIGGRMAVISFHSLEDRLVKRTFKKFVELEEGELVNKKAIGPSEEEIEVNPRSRSAKLRIIKKLK